MIRNYFKLTKTYIAFVFFVLFFLTIESKSNELFEIKAKKVEYNNTQDLIIAKGNANATHSSGKKIFADKILYFKSKNLIKTLNNSKFIDANNTLTADNFIYDTKSKVIEAKNNVILIDKDKNKFYFDSFIFNESSSKGKGVNIKAKISDGSYLISKEGALDNKEEKINLNSAKYTTCSKIKNNKDEYCPSWSLNSKQIIHDKKNKKIIHKHAVLKLKKIPVLYSPYISHPDPSVKRQSGFLPPIIKTLSNIGRTIQTPYYWAINDDKDITITPTYYFDEHDLIKASYRQAFQNGFLNIENGYSKGYRDLNKTGRTKGSRNYLFAEYIGEKKNLIFEDNQINFKIQRVSQQNFIRVNKINTLLFKEDIRTLENSFNISSIEQNKRFGVKVGIFENLDILDTGKYTYYLPDGVFSYNKKFKNFNSNTNSYFQGKKFSKDQKQIKIRNNILIDSNQKIFKKNGIGSKVKLALYNNNIHNDNVTNQKNNSNIDNYFTIALDNTLPLGKFSKNSYQILTPRVFIKYTSGKMQNAYNNEKILNHSDIFSMNRTNDLDTPETGATLGHGFDYVFHKNKENTNTTQTVTNFGLGQVLRKDEESLMPNKSSLNNSSSDIVGYLKYNLYGDKIDLKVPNEEKINFINNFKNNHLSINYNFNMENDFSEMINNNLTLSGSYNKFYTSLQFEEKNNHVGSNRSGSLNFKKLINDNYYFNFESKKNLKTDSSEYLRFGLNFENDCIVTSLTLSRDFYFDKDISSSKTIVFGIMIKPFADNFAPDLSDLIN